MRVGITAVASAFPDKIVTNDDLSQIMETSDEWIRSRTGIGQRHFVEPGTPCSALGTLAAERCLANRGITAEEIDLIIVGTITPDHSFPSTATRIQARIGASNAWGFDLAAACSGFLYAFSTAASLVKAGHSKKCLVVGADIMSSILNMEDRTTSVLFGDGAGCVLVEEVTRGGIIDAIMHTDGHGGDNLKLPAGGSAKPTSAETLANHEHYVHQNGREVFKKAVTEMAAVSTDLLAKNGKTGDDLTLFIPHQANIRIIESAAKRMKLPWEKVMINIDRRANTTAATLPTCMDDAVQAGRLKQGDLVLMATFGAGYTWGGVLMEWSF